MNSFWTTFPEIDSLALRRAIDSNFNWLVVNYGRQLEEALLPVLKMLDGIDRLLNATPWFVIVGIVVGVGFHATRSWKTAGGFLVMLILVGMVGLWKDLLSTVALMLTATIFTIILGIPLGIAMFRFNWLRSFLAPILDVMQTLPIFVYLIPFVMLFGPGQIPALLATLVFALPPIVRLTDLGLRQVDPDVTESVTSFGATSRQALLSAQLPLSMPSILAGMNQTTMMALSMVVIAALIGGGGLGYHVLQGIQRLELSRGLLAGVAIVFLAIILDRIMQAYGRRLQQHLDAGDR